MPENSLIDAATLEAYRQTEYIVFGPPRIILRVDRPSDGLASLHARHACAQSAYLTACNPYSRQTAAHDNARRQGRLLAQLRECGLIHLPGHGKHPGNGWTPEASVLVLDLSLEVGRDLATHHEQNAFLWSGADAIPRLILLR